MITIITVVEGNFPMQLTDGYVLVLATCIAQLLFVFAAVTRTLVVLEGNKISPLAGAVNTQAL